jgi:type I restriction-modification system DNA methylase subunit
MRSGLVYEYFLANFALAEGQGAGELFTPAAIVRLRAVDRVLSQLLQR